MAGSSLAFGLLTVEMLLVLVSTTEMLVR